MNSELVVSPPKTLAVVTLPPGSRFGPRQMLDWEFLWFLEGHSLFHSCNQTFEVPPGSLVLCVPGVTDAFTRDPIRPTRGVYVHFDVLKTPTGWPDWSKWPPVRPAREGDPWTFGFRHLLALEGRNPLAAQMTLSLMLAAWLENPSPRELPSQALPVALDLAIKFVYSRLQADPICSLSLPELARASHVSAGHLCRLSQKYLGKTPAQIVMAARLDCALGSVVHTDRPMALVAREQGFADAAHFSRAFSKAFGMSPRECRNRVLAGEVPPSQLLQNFAL